MSDVDSFTTIPEDRAFVIVSKDRPFSPFICPGLREDEGYRVKHICIFCGERFYLYDEYDTDSDQEAESVHIRQNHSGAVLCLVLMGCQFDIDAMGCLSEEDYEDIIKEVNSED